MDRGTRAFGQGAFCARPIAIEAATIEFRCVVRFSAACAKCRGACLAWRAWGFCGGLLCGGMCIFGRGGLGNFPVVEFPVARLGVVWLVCVEFFVHCVCVPVPFRQIKRSRWGCGTPQISIPLAARPSNWPALYAHIPLTSVNLSQKPRRHTRPGEWKVRRFAQPGQAAHFLFPTQPPPPARR